MGWRWMARRALLISTGKRRFWGMILQSAHTVLCCWCLITRCGKQEIMVQLGVIKLQLSMSLEAPVLAGTHWTGTCHQHCADLIFIRSQAHSILLPTDAQPLSKRLKSLRQHIILPLVVTPWLTTISCVLSSGAHLSAAEWKNQFQLLASSGLFTEPKCGMTHSNGDSVLLDPFFCGLHNTSTTWQTKKVRHWRWFMQSSHSLDVRSCLVRFADCDKPRYIDSSDL